MTSFRIHFRPSKRSEVREGKLFIRVIHERRVRNLTTDHTLLPEEWDEKSHSIIFPENAPDRRLYLRRIQMRMRIEIAHLQESAAALSLVSGHTVDDICQYYTSTQSLSLQLYCEQVSSRLEDSGRIRTARAYRSAVKSLIRFNGGKDLRLGDICGELLRTYEEHLIESNLYMNTVSFYMRNLRALYHRAVKDKLILQQEENPFSGVFTGICETKKRALNQNELNSLARFEKKLSKEIRRNDSDGNYREMRKNLCLQCSLMYFMFGFHARGMSFIDIAYLRKSEIRDESITYKRKKTGGWLEIRITKPMREIISYFAEETVNSPYVFPLIRPFSGNERNQYESGLRLQNFNLKILAQQSGIGKTLTTHVARHTWATLAKWSKVEIALISEALGHKDIKTTYKYLASFERSTMDKLSEKMSGVIKKRANKSSSYGFTPHYSQK